jgi:sugar lactone lactonase YvrE
MLWAVSQSGRLIRVAPDATRSVVAQDLLFPDGVAVNQAGHAYITLFSVMPGMGTVVRVQ